jgi:hypothetical protein
MVYDFGGTGVNSGRNSEDLSTFFENGKNRNLFSLMDYFHQGWPEIHLTDNGGIMDLSHRSFYAWTAMPPLGEPGDSRGGGGRRPGSPGRNDGIP